ncbi:hypothetical protein DMA11_16200 [Marinilabiliaceae bacterium JC017]|nr:hypothetical protein DMA11_16200 [Marinilabiliaceae bacterium JC017]
MKHLIPILTVIFFASCMDQGDKISQWRGKDRDGIYFESNLLKKWPDQGPSLLWASEEVGNGYGSPVITTDNVFVNGEIDSTGYLFSFDLEGNLLWKSAYGKEWMVNYIGSRSTPTVVEDLVYVCSGMGDVACFSVGNGEQKWALNMIEQFNGKNIRFGYSQSLLVDEDKVYCAPGGADTNIVALNRFTGEKIWICKGVGEISAYCSPLLIQLPARKLLVTFSDNAFLGVDVETGKLLWTYKQPKGCDIHGNTPIYEDGYLYYATGCGDGTVKLKLAEDGSSVTEVWTNKSIDNIQGGFVKIDDYLYGIGYRKKYLKKVAVETGEVKDSLAFDRGITIYADSMLYCYNEKGKMGLVKPENLQLVSQFPIEKGTEEHYAHPAIRDGVLYVRHGNALMAYSIKKES